MLIALHASDSVTVLYHHKWSNINGTGEANIRVLMPFSLVRVHLRTTSLPKTGW